MTRRDDFTSAMGTIFDTVGYNDVACAGEDNNQLTRLDIIAIQRGMTPCLTYSVKEAAALTGFSEDWVRNAAERDELHASRPAEQQRGVRFKPEAILKWVDSL